MKYVILAGICLPENRSSFAYSMEECIQLISACGMETVDTVTQQSQSKDPRTAFRKGKLEELRESVVMHEADGVVFFNSISIDTADRISAAVGVEVIDRTALILQIFSMRARSSQAKLQTKLARLSYDLPRVLRRNEESSQHARGSYRNRGAGEMRSDIIERKYRGRMAVLRNELKKIAVQRTQDENRRAKTLLKRVALIGYTNAGKSSLMNALIQMTNGKGSEIFAEDMLFATLDTSVRKIEYENMAYYLYDTVGFVSDLPHSLVEAFQSTLDAAKDADLLLQVIDVSDERYEEKITVTEETLKAIGADHIPILRVYNKCDLINGEVHGLRVSCVTHEGLKELQQEILKRIYPDEEQGEYVIPYQRMDLLHKYRPVMKVKNEQYTDDGIQCDISGEKKYLTLFQIYRKDKK